MSVSVVLFVCHGLYMPELICTIFKHSSAAEYFMVVLSSKTLYISLC